VADRSVLHSLAVTLADADSVPDAELLRRYADSGDSVAFELLVRRHAELVWSVCRSVHPTDHPTAEDAFQATFLALARKAASVKEASAAGWLFRVARNTAVRAKRFRPPPLSEEVPVVSPDRVESAEVARIVSEEVDRLAAKFREPVLLCFYEGMSHAQAAEHLGWAIGTVASRLARAKDRLRDRLTRRGVALPAVTVGVLTGGNAPAAAIRAVALGTTTDAVRTLSTEVLRAMTTTKLTLTTAGILVALLLGGTGAVLAWKPELRRNAPPPKTRPVALDDHTRLQGKWKAVKAVIDGVDVPADEVKGMEWEFAGETIRIVEKPGGELLDAAFTLDTVPSPRRLDMTMQEAANLPANLRTGKPTELLGIYELKGDKLTVCQGRKDKGGRPTEFESDKTNKAMLIVFEKDDPKKADKPKGDQSDPKKLAEDELKKLQGKWKVLRMNTANGPAPADAIKGMTWEFDGNKLIGRSPGAPVAESEFIIDASASPKRIDTTMAGPTGTLKSLGIYEIAGDKLKICQSLTHRPTEFKAGDSSGVIELEKETPMKEGQPKAKPPTKEEEQKAIQGKWRPVKIASTEGEAPADELKGMLWEIDGDKIFATDKPGEDKKEEMSFTLDPSKSPKHIDLTALTGPAAVKGKVMPAIYELKGGKLTLCLRPAETAGDGRPTEFKGGKGEQTAVIVLEKVEKK
jgi:RNA polymerase sigma factor (sigma-70 family)